jgi:hypothetical protein
MNPEQKFDKIIRKKVDEAEFPFDEQNWNKLSMQLDAERRLATSRGWGKFLFLGLLFLGITSASIAVYKIQGPSGIKGQLASGNTGSNDNDGSSAQAQGANANKNSNYNSDNNLLASNNSNNQTVGLANYTGSSANDINNTLAVNSNNANVADNSSTNNSNSENVSSSEKANNSTVAKGKKGSKYISGSKGLGKKGLAALNEDGSSKSGDANEMTEGSRTKRILDGDVLLEHNALNRIDSKLNIVYSNRNVKLGALKIPSWYDEDYRRKGKKRMSFLNAEAGGAFLLGWDSKDGKDGRGLNWYAGVNYGKFLNKKFGFSAGSQFYNVGNIKQSFYESSKSVYGLGSTSSNTVITTKSLFYFSVPVKIYYAVSPAHQIGASVSPSFLFSSKNVVETYRLTDNIKSNEMTSNSSGIYEGVRLNNVLVSAFYKAQLNKRLFLNTEVMYGVRDIFKNTSSNNYSQKPIGLRLGLQYTLFEK